MTAAAVPDGRVHFRPSRPLASLGTSDKARPGSCGLGAAHGRLHARVKVTVNRLDLSPLETTLGEVGPELVAARQRARLWDAED